MPRKKHAPAPTAEDVVTLARALSPEERARLYELVGHREDWIEGQVLVSAWWLRMLPALFECGKLPEPARVGAYRVLSPDDLPRVEQALRQAGYLPAGGGDVA